MKDSYREEIFNSLIEHPSWKNELESFASLLGEYDWLVVPAQGKKQIKSLKTKTTQLKLSKSKLVQITALIAKSQKSKIVQSARNSKGSYTYCIPIIRNVLYCFW